MRIYETEQIAENEQISKFGKCEYHCEYYNTETAAEPIAGKYSNFFLSISQKFVLKNVFFSQKFDKKMLSLHTEALSLGLQRL